jgi:hypothetical protein
MHIVLLEIDGKKLNNDNAGNNKNNLFDLAVNLHEYQIIYIFYNAFPLSFGVSCCLYYFCLMYREQTLP